MSAFFYGVALQWKLDIRNKSLLITCYIVPLLFFAIMGGIFTSVLPDAQSTLIQSMTVMGVSMGAFIGFPQSLAEIYAGDMKKAYKANGVPTSLGLVTLFLSAFIHLMIMSAILLLVAPIAFDSVLPTNLPLYLAALSLYVAVSLSSGCVLGLAVKQQAKLTMIAQLVFLPSIMLSGIMFPIDLLPKAFEMIGKIFPAFWGYRLMISQGFHWGNLFPLLLILAAAVILSIFLFKRRQLE